MKDNEIEYIEVGRTKLTDRSLNEIVYRIKSRYGLDVVSIEETKDGYVFIGKHNFTIGDVTYNPYSHTYDPFNFHRGVVESIQAKDRELQKHREANKRKQYRLQKNIKIGVAFTLAGVIALTSLGVIKSHNEKANETIVPDTGIVAQESHLNTFASSNDLILLSWANYAMSGLGDTCDNSPYESFQSIKGDVYANMFVPIMSSYYNYLDMIDSGLPHDIVGDSIARNHQDFRNNAKKFNDYLGEQYFGEYTFENSPYADAIVMDESGKVISTTGDITGELQDEEGKVITFDSDNIKVYIKATSIPGQNFTLENLPTDAVLHNGDAYVLASHLYDDLSQEMSK